MTEIRESAIDLPSGQKVLLDSINRKEEHLPSRRARLAIYLSRPKFQ